jgi:hypothetical protein
MLSTQSHIAPWWVRVFFRAVYGVYNRGCSRVLHMWSELLLPQYHQQVDFGDAEKQWLRACDPNRRVGVRPCVRAAMRKYVARTNIHSYAPVW